MRDLLGWNISLGTWVGVQVRLHVFFLLFALFAIFFAERDGMLRYGVLSVVILFGSALAHELGHCYAATRIGGRAEQILIWPLGGLAHVYTSHDPRAELITTLSGPLVNLLLCVLLIPSLMLTGSEVLPLLNPLVPPVPLVNEISPRLVMQLALWINWLLVLINLLPAFPLDGGRALRAMLWPRFGYRTAVLYVVRAAKLTAVVLIVMGWMLREQFEFAPLPLTMLAVFLYFSGKQETERLQENDPGDGFLGYDFSQGYTSLEKQFQPRLPTSQPGFIRRWLDERRAAKLQKLQQLEAEEERRVDDILARLHEVGRDQLSPSDRALLDRVSARYRNRSQS